MLEKLIKNIGRKFTSVALAGTLLLGSGCATYRTMSSRLIQPVTPIERPIERPIDYSKLTWQEAIEYVQTPEQAQDYLDRHFTQEDQSSRFIPGIGTFGKQKGETFRYNHSISKGDCFDYSTSVAALLSDNGYPPLLLDMRDDSGGHTVFLYKTANGFGVLGNTPLPPKYEKVTDILNEFANLYGWNFDHFNIYNLDNNFSSREWISGDVNLYKSMKP